MYIDIIPMKLHPLARVWQRFFMSPLIRSLFPVLNFDIIIKLKYPMTIIKEKLYNNVYTSYTYFRSVQFPLCFIFNFFFGKLIFPTKTHQS